MNSKLLPICRTSSLSHRSHEACSNIPLHSTHIKTLAIFRWDSAMYIPFIIINFHTNVWGPRGTLAQACDCNSDGCGFNPHSRELIIIYRYYHFYTLVTRQSTALSSVTQHILPPEWGGEWGTRTLNKGESWFGSFPV